MSDINLRNETENYQLDLIRKDIPELNSLLSVYPVEQFSKILANKEKLKQVTLAFSNISSNTVVNAIVMTCNSTCPYNSVCILKANNMDPTGYLCPIEKKLVMELESDIVQSLTIDRADPIEMELLWDLIDAKLLDLRASGALKNGDLVQVITNTIGKMTTTRQELSPVMEIKVDLKRLKHSIMDTFIATRRAKKKYGMAQDGGVLEKILEHAAKRIAENGTEKEDFDR